MNTSRFTLGAIVAGAFAASLCCLGPLLVALLGIGGAGLFQKFEFARPYLMAATGALLAFGFYLAYRPEKVCAEGAVCDTNSGFKRLGKISIWLVTLLATGLMGFPYYSGRLLAGALKSSAPAAPQSVTTVLKVTGMTCGGCAVSVKKALLALPGVESAEIDLSTSEATVRHDPRLTDAALKEAVVKAGYGIAGESAPPAAPALAAPTASALTPITPEKLKASFNAARDRVRVVALLSPTCPYCIRGQSALKNLFSGQASMRLSGFVVWQPMLKRDDAGTAASQSVAWEDSRVMQGWDGRRQIGERFTRTLGLKETAWDVYLVYPPGVEWKDDAPPPPALWMHQLGPDSGADPNRRLDEAKLGSAVTGMLKQAGG